MKGVDFEDEDEEEGRGRWPASSGSREAGGFAAGPVGGEEEEEGGAPPGVAPEAETVFLGLALGEKADAADHLGKIAGASATLVR